MKVPIAERYYLEIICTEFYPSWSTNLESTGGISFTTSKYELLSRYSWNSRSIDSSPNFVNILQKVLARDTRSQADSWMTGVLYFVKDAGKGKAKQAWLSEVGESLNQHISQIAMWIVGLSG